MTDATSQKVAPRPTGARAVILSLKQPKVLLTLALGFGSGLPFLLTGNTLGLWLREYNVTLAMIGFLSWVGLAYSFKFLWAPVIDKVDAPIFAKLGRRRSWMALAQILTGMALVAMAIVGPGNLIVLGATALVVAFASATQDIVVDAWRIETAEDSDDLGLLTSAFQLGYRFAILAANSLILFVAAGIGWNGAYGLFGALMGLALLATFLAREPLSQVAIAAAPTARGIKGLLDAIVGPFIVFLKTHKTMALLMLAAISFYRLPDFVMGPMVGPFYVDLGITKEAIGSARLSFGLVGTLIGIAAAGLCALRLGFGRTLLLGAILGPGSNLAYTALAFYGPQGGGLFFVTLFIENFSEGFAGAALVAYMSSLTSIGYTATQYALLSSFYALLGKLLKGFSGQVVETLQIGHAPLNAYAIFFAGTAAVGIPAFVLCLILNHIARKKLMQTAS
ncbi:MFS transporter [Asticcacaulis sp. ZE23SCel15]|uniref:AmpG family muropeptide MFS transporter n=1 Tax=Asticcacaulis sp. ZE23SCel15 TaxID=3059027 RepID=UPI00265F5AC2|nr:MFS transporter [Asticcacaulis sp. ZE23SCel15]WKL58412.1 MFS transporter [Asticcacaulis sp. ZE23SCel15]